MKRIHSIDFTRGLVMIIMALDHVRDMIHVDSINQSPTNLTTTTPVLFFTRWITYLCAPTFVFLAGTSAYLSFQRNNNVADSSRFLLKRGLYLVLLEFVVVNTGLFFDLGFHMFLFEVIATIGCGFIILSLLLTLSTQTIGIIGLIIIFGHNLAPLIPLAETSLFKKILMPFFAPAAFPFSNRVFVMGYPPIPWLGIMLTGFATGRFFQLPESKRRGLFIKIGLSAIVLFVIVRFTNIYGDAFPWSPQKSPLLTVLSFMNVTKYPPSLVFCLITLGIMCWSLALSEGAKGKLFDVISVYGKVPLFYFLIHFFLIHFILLGILFCQGFHWSQLDFASGTFGRPKGVESGLPLSAVYLIWIAVVVFLYKPCQWFGRYKAAHPHWWLKYI
ncbi:MAG: heparan-alpha-glucosaminide N-acetyltransferase domain-containing protein [Bacteroidota bacterium]|nr:heparan-alpha-glucosaminide N-acetyltransferase domain-containing protein [Bacteroidota bacterium]